MSKFSQLRCKEVINVKNGIKLGFVDDAEFDNETGQITSITILGPARLFGVFARENDYIIKWDDIQKIGDDTVLVSCDIVHKQAEKKENFFVKFFSAIFK